MIKKLQIQQKEIKRVRIFFINKNFIADRDQEHRKIIERKESFGNINKSSIKEDKFTEGISVHMSEKNISEVNIQSEINKTIQTVNTLQSNQNRLSSSITEINGKFTILFILQIFLTFIFCYLIRTPKFSYI